MLLKDPPIAPSKNSRTPAQRLLMEAVDFDIRDGGGIGVFENLPLEVSEGDVA